MAVEYITVKGSCTKVLTLGRKQEKEKLMEVELHVLSDGGGRQEMIKYAKEVKSAWSGDKK